MPFPPHKNSLVMEMKQHGKTAACLALCGLMLWFLADAAQVREAAAAGLRLCGRSVIPALFPFMAASTMLVSMGFGEWEIGRASCRERVYPMV